VVVTTADGGDGNQRLVVRDEGTGIPRDYLDRIMDPFFTTKREQGGTGLGLSLALSILTDHGGQLSFESGPGYGTTATVVLRTLT
jgi:signal transduction histidine kinase